MPSSRSKITASKGRKRKSRALISGNDRGRWVMKLPLASETTRFILFAILFLVNLRAAKNALSRYESTWVSPTNNKIINPSPGRILPAHLQTSCPGRAALPYKHYRNKSNSTTQRTISQSVGTNPKETRQTKLQPINQTTPDPLPFQPVERGLRRVKTNNFRILNRNCS